MQWKVALLAVSAKGSRGEREDTSAQVARELIEEELFGGVVDYRIVPDDQVRIGEALIALSGSRRIDLILTTGGIGLFVEDRTPEATAKITERLVPGITEAMRSIVCRRSSEGYLFRGICGIRNQTLILNLPGDPKGVHDYLMAVIDILPQALEQLSNQRVEQKGQS